MTFEEIENIGLNDKISELVELLVDTSTVPAQLNAFEVNGSYVPEAELSADENFYNSLVWHESLTPPTFAQFMVELNELKWALEKEKEDKFRADLFATDSWSQALLDLAYWNAGDKVVPQKVLESVIKERDEVKWLALTTQALAVKASKEARELVRVRKAKGMLARQMCEEALDTVAGHNIANSLTPAQKDQMETDFAPIMVKLSANRPAQARALIAAVAVDGVMVTQELKDELLEVLDLGKFA